MLPLVKGRDNPITQTGENWFNEQDEDTQRRVMGDSKWEAWNDGKFEFNQLSKEHENDIYGMMRGSVSLKELLGE